MKKYTKIIASVICAIAFTFGASTFAAEKVASGNVVQTTTVGNDSLFNANEFGLTLTTGYAVDKTGSDNEYAFNLSAGASYFFTRYLGAEVNVPFYQSEGVSVDEVQAGVLLRLPLSKSTPVLKNFAPYIGVGGVYNWNDQYQWEYIGKAGLEFRFNSKWGVFAEYQIRNHRFDISDSERKLQGGVRFVF